MRQEIGRRAFVGTLIAGVPLLAGGPALLAAPRAAARGQSAGRGKKPLDPLIEYTIRELGGIQSRAHAAHHMRGEDARAAAQQLRTVALYAQGIGMDASVRSSLQALVADKGRDALLYAEMDKAGAIQAMRDFGFQIDTLPDTTGVDYATRAVILDSLLTGGVTSGLRAQADLLARAAAELDRQASIAKSPFVRVDDSWWWTGFCSSLQTTIAQLQAEAAILASIAFLYPDLVGAYYLVEAAIGVDMVIYAAACIW